jgi:uncharacterized protein (DUF488 family)
MNPIELFTIGFTRKSAEVFFTRLREAGARTLIDVRLNNSSQLAGFTKKEDLRFFLKSIAGIEYVHLPELAPTQALLDTYKKQKGKWEDYEAGFLDLMRQRKVESSLSKSLFEGGCLLCSEEKPHHCHRRLVAEYLQARWGQVRTTHLK